ncbi:MAG: DUF3352 domain-containing protein [Chloroflexota bacterium]|nr:DUF3352 domain-containing protein [Chloroflexota bacterium]
MSTSIPAASGLSGARIAIIGAFGVLAVGIGVAAGAFLLTNRTAAVGAGAAYVPASAPFYVEMRLDPSAGQDRALRELLGRFPPIEGVDLAQPLYEQLGDHVDELLAAEGTEVSWSADVAPWFDGRVGMAVLDIPVSAMAGSMDAVEAPSMVVLVGVTDRAAAESSIERLLAEADEAPTFTEQTHDGVVIRVGGDEGAYAITDDQLLFAPAADDIVAALDARASGDSTLAEADEITRLTDALPADWLAFGVYDMTDLMEAAIDEAGTESTAMADAFGALLENQPLRGAFAVTGAGDRIALEAASDAPTGAFAAENAERGLAAEVPADVLYFSEAGNVGATMAAIIEPMKDAVASMPEGEEQLATMEAALGADLEELVSWIDDGALAIGFDGSEPYGGLVLVPNDVAAAERRLGQLASFAGLAGLDPESGVTVEESEVGSVTVTTIRWDDSGAMPDAMLPAPTGVVVQYAVTDDRALIGLGDSFVGRVLELDEADALASVERYTAAVAELGGASNVAVTWVDIAGVRAAVESALGPMIGMMDPEGSFESEVEPWLAPLDAFVSVTRVEDELLLQRAALLVE